MLNQVLNLLFSVLPVDRGAILTRDTADPSVFRPVAVKVKPHLTKSRIGISKTILQQCLSRKVAIMTCDAPRDERFDAAASIVANNITRCFAPR
jgi:hypothetical protein